MIPMFVNEVESADNVVWCPKHREKVDTQTCHLCSSYKKVFFAANCHWKTEYVARVSACFIFCHLPVLGLYAKK